MPPKRTRYKWEQAHAKRPAVTARRSSRVGWIVFGAAGVSLLLSFLLDWPAGDSGTAWRFAAAFAAGWLLLGLIVSRALPAPRRRRRAQAGAAGAAAVGGTDWGIGGEQPDYVVFDGSTDGGDGD